MQGKWCEHININTRIGIEQYANITPAHSSNIKKPCKAFENTNS